MEKNDLFRKLYKMNIKTFFSVYYKKPYYDDGCAFTHYFRI